MYFPYLYARLGELKAIEDLAGRLGAPQRIVPVLEPVKSNTRALKSALSSLRTAGESTYLIVNPSRHQLASPVAAAAWSVDMSANLTTSTVRPTLEIRAATTLTDVTAFLALFAGRPLGLSIRSDHLAGSDLDTATTGLEVTFFLHSAADPASYSDALGAHRCVEVRDSFRAALRNADYSGEELFTTAHQNFSTDGHPGFSDYTLLPGRFNASGGPLGAAVIHLSFADRRGSLKVQHFVSDETRQYQSDQPTKLMEAMRKVDTEVRSNPTKFRSTPGLTSFQSQFAARRPTNPTYNKRQQISHHIDTVAGII